MPTRTCRAKHLSLLFLPSSSSRRTPVKWSAKLGPPECLNLAQHPGDRNSKPPFPRLRLYGRPDKRSIARCVSIPDNHRRLFDGGDDLQVAATMRVALRSL